MLKKQDLARAVLEQYPDMVLSTPVKVECVVDTIFETIEKALIHDVEVRIAKFGKFKTVQYAGRKIGGGCTGREHFLLPERRAVKFVASRVLRAKVKGKDH